MRVPHRGSGPQGSGRGGVWAGVVAALAGMVAAAAAVWAHGAAGPRRCCCRRSWRCRSGWSSRPAELAAVVEALVGGQAGTVGITTGLYGAGGFGKTTLAQMVCADRRVQAEVRGAGVSGDGGPGCAGAAAVAAKVNDVIKLVAGEDATFTDPQLAGRRLGSLLDAGPRRLLVLDDVWEARAAGAVHRGRQECARLVTTRVPGLLAGGAWRCGWIRCRRSRRGRC